MVETYNGDQRRQAVEAFLKSGMPQKAFAKLHGIAERSLWKWLKQYEAAGPKRSRTRSGGVRTVQPVERDRTSRFYWASGWDVTHRLFRNLERPWGFGGLRAGAGQRETNAGMK
jgi:Helix-turn-helix domain